MSCQEYEAVKLKRHQRAVSDYLRKHRGLIAYFGVGTGKTITALTAARCTKLPTLLVVPPAVIGGFRREIDRLGELHGLDIELLSYGVFAGKPLSYSRGKLLVIDEVHNFRSAGSTTLHMICAAHMATKVLLLSGTPLQNEPADLVSLLVMLANGATTLEGAKREYNAARNAFDKALATFETTGRYAELDEILAGKVIYYMNKAGNPKFPTMREEYVLVKMTRAYLAEYNSVEEGKRLPADLKGINLAVFYNGLRRATNKVKTESPKIAAVMKCLAVRLDKGHKCIVYSTWQDSGISIIRERLAAKGVKTVSVSGEDSTADKADAVRAFNSGRAPVILITKAGAAGLDLKQARCVIIMEPHWNEELINQVIGRAVRYESHIDLPPSQQNVTVYRFIIERPDGQSVDQIIDRMSKVKAARCANFYKAVKRARIRY